MKQAGETYSAAKASVEAIYPAVRDTAAALRNGAGTSEWKSMAWTQRVLSIAAAAAPTLEIIVSSIQEMPFAGNAWWVSGVAIGLKAVLSGVYSMGRAKIKTAAASPPVIKVEGAA